LDPERKAPWATDSPKNAERAANPKQKTMLASAGNSGFPVEKEKAL
jgi:hypothetical protein